MRSVAACSEACGRAFRFKLGGQANQATASKAASQEVSTFPRVAILFVLPMKLPLPRFIKPPDGGGRNYRFLAGARPAVCEEIVARTPVFGVHGSSSPITANLQDGRWPLDSGSRI